MSPPFFILKKPFHYRKGFFYDHKSKIIEGDTSKFPEDSDKLLNLWIVDQNSVSLTPYPIGGVFRVGEHFYKDE